MEPTVVEERELIRFERAEEYFILLGAFLQNKSSEILKDGSVNIKDIKVISEQSASLLSKEELLSKMSELVSLGFIRLVHLPSIEMTYSSIFLPRLNLYPWLITLA